MANALVLPVEKVAGTEPQVIPGLPGRWVPGQLYSVDVLGVSEDRIAEMISLYNWPLEIVTAGAGEDVHAFFDPRENHVPSSYQSTEAARAADVKAETPDVIVTDTGLAIEPPAPAPETAESWAQDARDRATALNEGETPEDTAPMNPIVSGDTAGGGGMVAADGLSPDETLRRAELATELSGLKVGDLDERYGDLEDYPADALKDDKLAWAFAHEGLED